MGIGKVVEDEPQTFEFPSLNTSSSLYDMIMSNKKEDQYILANLLVEEFSKPPTQEEITSMNQFFTSHLNPTYESPEIQEEPLISFAVDWTHKKGKLKPQQYWVYCEDNQANYSKIQLHSKLLNINSRSRLATSSLYPKTIIFIEDFESDKPKGIIIYSPIGSNSSSRLISFPKHSLSIIHEKDITFQLDLVADKTQPIHPLQGVANSVHVTKIPLVDAAINSIPYSYLYQFYFKNRSEGWYQLKASLCYQGIELFEGKSALFMFNNPRMKNKKSLMNYSPQEIKFMQSFALDNQPKHEENWLELGLQLGFSDKTFELLTQSIEIFSKKTQKRYRPSFELEIQQTRHQNQFENENHFYSPMKKLCTTENNISYLEMSTEVSISPLSSSSTQIGVPSPSNYPLLTSPSLFSVNPNYFFNFNSKSQNYQTEELIQSNQPTCQYTNNNSSSLNNNLNDSFSTYNSLANSSEIHSYLSSPFADSSIRCICDSHFNSNTPSPDDNNTTNTINVNNSNNNNNGYTVLYQWLNNEGRLQRESFVMIRCSNSIQSLISSISEKETIKSPHSSTSSSIGSLFALVAEVVTEVNDDNDWNNVLSQQSITKIIISPPLCSAIPTVGQFVNSPQIINSDNNNINNIDISMTDRSPKNILLEKNNIEEFTFTVSLNGDIREVYTNRKTLFDLKNAIANEFNINISQIANILKEITKAAILHDKNVEKLKETEILLISIV